jgi:O-antigen/teichoic acid export membrane protein
LNLWIFSNKVFQLAVNALLHLLLIRYFSPSEFGEFAISLAFLSLWQVLLSLRLPMQVISQEKMDFNFYWSAALQEALFVFVLLGTILLVNQSYSFQLLLLLLAHLFLRLVDVLKAFQERLSKHEEILRIEFLVCLFVNGATLLGAIQGAGSWILAAREVTVAFLLAGILYFKLPLQLQSIGIKDWRNLVRLSRPLWVDGIFEQGLSRLSILIAHQLGGESGAGIFYQAQRLISLIHTQLCSSISRYAFHLFSRSSTIEETKAIFKKLYQWTIFPLTIGFILILWQGDKGVILILGKSWSAAAVVVKAMSGALIFITLFSIQKMYILSISGSKELLQARVWQVIGLFSPCIVSPVKEVWVLGLGFSLGYFFSFLRTYLCIRKHFASVLTQKVSNQKF